MGHKIDAQAAKYLKYSHFVEKQVVFCCKACPKAVRENIANTVCLQLSEWQVHMLLQYIASWCVPCWKDTSAEFGRNFLAWVLFALSLSFEQVWFLIPGYGSKSRLYHIWRVTSLNFVGSTPWHCTQHPWQEKSCRSYLMLKKFAADNRAWKWQSSIENLVHQKSSGNET